MVVLAVLALPKRQGVPAADHVAVVLDTPDVTVPWRAIGLPTSPEPSGPASTTGGGVALTTGMVMTVSCGMSQTTAASNELLTRAVVVSRSALIVMELPTAPAVERTLTSGVTRVPGGNGPGWAMVKTSAGPIAAVLGVGLPLIVAVPWFWIVPLVK